MNAYVVCIPCKQGKLENLSEGEHLTGAFQIEHIEHGAPELIVESVFLEDYLANGFIDVDRPEAKPIKTKFQGTAPRAQLTPPFGMPGAGSDGVRAQTRALQTGMPMSRQGRRAMILDAVNEAKPALGRPFEELRDSGLLWLINRVVFHPRGLSLAIHFDDDKRATGWSLIGNGSEVISFDGDQDDRGFIRANETLVEALLRNSG